MWFTFIAFIFALALACVAGMEYVYLKFFEAQNRQMKRRLKELERENAELSGALQRAEEVLEEYSGEGEEIWPELIDDN
jgi:F0F1-type ATP synthase membrane subunit b/b'